MNTIYLLEKAFLFVAALGVIQAVWHRTVFGHLGRLLLGPTPSSPVGFITRWNSCCAVATCSQLVAHRWPTVISCCGRAWRHKYATVGNVIASTLERCRVTNRPEWWPFLEFWNRLTVYFARTWCFTLLASSAQRSSGSPALSPMTDSVFAAYVTRQHGTTPHTKTGGSACQQILSMLSGHVTPWPGIRL